MKRTAAVLAVAVLGLSWNWAVAGADFGGDGRDDIGIFRPASGLWSVRGITRVYFGGSGDIPVPGDYNNNGKDDIAIFRPVTGLWAVRGLTRAYYGGGTDIPLSAPGGRWTPKGNNLYFTAGNVGIGTDSLYVQDRLTVDGGRGYFVNSPWHGVEIANTGWSALYIHDTPYNGIDIIDCGQNFISAGPGGSAFIVQSTGRVGIGTASPTYQLEVRGGSNDAGWFETTASNGRAVGGKSNFGVGIYGESSSGYAGWFNGDVNITGTLYKTGGSFRIDHPLDPENRYLSHSFVESPDMMNIYNGTAVLDGSGEAAVTLPDWFEALNRDFRYQLTPLGAPGPNLYISQKVSGNSFRIAGGTPGMEVSWQVTGIRRDPWAEDNRIQVEEEKPESERGSYLYPEGYGRPESNSVTGAQLRMKGAPEE
ncbi:MAG: hypothetical protein V1789_03080 [PVC group bacterium]